ncbi:MAG: protein kinase domain-containing protein, partial [Ktedonobacteraceae bacterium]
MITSCFCPHCGADNAPTNTLCHACQQPLAIPETSETLETAVLLNERYSVLAEVGAGGFGAVYRARDTWEQDRLVAVKQINLKGLSPQEIIEATDAFNREAHILTALSHPLLPCIFDRFNDPEHWYLVMNFIDGLTLDEYLQQHVANALPARVGLSLEETLTIGLHLCDVLHYLHTQQPPIIFRDIKPGNIMRTPSGQLYLIDFGIARHFKPGQTKDTIPFGSPGFAAPEQYGRAQTTPQADIYSLGALLYCLISGDDPAEHPFQFPPLRFYNIDGIRELDALIQRMVALDVTQRPADILAVRSDIQALQRLHVQANQQHIWLPPQSQTPPAASSFTIAKTPTRKTSRRNVVTAALVVGGAALVGGIMTALNTPQSNFLAFPRHKRYQYQTNTFPANSQNTGITGNQLPPSVFWSSDLSYGAAVNTSQNSIDIYNRQGAALLASNSIPLPSFASEFTIQWTPDNQRLILIPDNNNAVVWNVNGGKSAFVLFIGPLGVPAVVAWSPNSKYLAVEHADPNNNVSTLFAIFDASNGNQLFQQSSTMPITTCLAWTADSQSILFPVPYNNMWGIDVWNSQTYQQSSTLGTFDNVQFDASLMNIPVMACSPTSNQIAFTYDGSIWLGKLTDPHYLQQLTNFLGIIGSNDPSALIWSPNEQYLALLIQNNLSIWDTSNGQNVQLNYDVLQNDINACAWSADSQSVTV